jgi:hypothetical protein
MAWYYNMVLSVSGGTGGAMASAPVAGPEVDGDIPRAAGSQRLPDGVVGMDGATCLGNGVFAWGHERLWMLPDRIYLGGVTAYDAAARPLAMGYGDIVIGDRSTVATLTGSRRPCIFEFDPLGTRGQGACQR